MGAIKTMSVIHTHAIKYIIVTCAVLRESTFIMPRRGDEDVKGGAPKYFLILKGGSESSRFTEGGQL